MNPTYSIQSSPTVFNPHLSLGILSPRTGFKKIKNIYGKWNNKTINSFTLTKKKTSSSPDGIHNHNIPIKKCNLLQTSIKRHLTALLKVRMILIATPSLELCAFHVNVVYVGWNIRKVDILAKLLLAKLGALKVALFCTFALFCTSTCQDFKRRRSVHFTLEEFHCPTLAY